MSKYFRRKYSIKKALNEMSAPKGMSLEDFNEKLGAGGEAQWRFAQHLVNKLQDEDIDAWAQVVKGRGGNDIVLHVDDNIKRYEIKHLEKGTMLKKAKKGWFAKITDAIQKKAKGELDKKGRPIKIPTLSGSTGKTPWIEFSGPFQDMVAKLGGKFVRAKPSAKIHFGEKARTKDTTFDDATMLKNYRKVMTQIEDKKGPYYNLFKGLKVTTGTLSKPEGDFIGLEGFSQQNTVYTYDEGVKDLLDQSDPRERFHRAIDNDKKSQLAGVILHKYQEDVENEEGETVKSDVAVLRYLDPARKAGILCPTKYNIRLENPDPTDWGYFTIPKTTSFDQVMKDYLDTQGDEYFYAGASWNFTGGKTEDMTFESATQIPATNYPAGLDPKKFDAFWLVPKGAGRYDVKFILGGAESINLKDIATEIENENLFGYSLPDQVGKREEFLLNQQAEEEN